MRQFARRRLRRETGGRSQGAARSGSRMPAGRCAERRRGHTPRCSRRRRHPAAARATHISSCPAAVWCPPPLPCTSFTGRRHMQAGCALLRRGAQRCRERDAGGWPIASRFGVGPSSTHARQRSCVRAAPPPGAAVRSWTLLPHQGMVGSARAAGTASWVRHAGCGAAPCMGLRGGMREGTAQALS